MHLRNGSATIEARERVRYAHPREAPFDERSLKHVTLAVGSFGRLGESGAELVDEIATSIVGGPDGGRIRRKGVVKERFLQVISVTAQIVILRRVDWCRLAIPRRQQGTGASTRGDMRRWK